MTRRSLTRNLSALLTISLLFQGLRNDACADEPQEPDRADQPQVTPMTDPLPFNLKLKTLGGRQVWGDVLFFHGYRIQHNILTGHYRLIDADDVRHAWGTREQCQSRLEQIREQQQLPPMSGKAVILIHGVVRSSKSFAPMRTKLEQAGYRVVGFDYPSTRVSITKSAAYLEQVIQSLHGVEEIHLVVHSMGGLVVRAYLERPHAPDPKIQGMVMLGVPNQGAKMANILQKNLLYKAIYGPAGQELVDDPDGLIAQLPIPNFAFAVISGARGTNEGYNPIIPGDDDGTVSVESTRLPGAADSMTVNALHSFLMGNKQVIEATVRFLKTGALRASGEKVPIPSQTDQTP